MRRQAWRMKWNANTRHGRTAVSCGPCVLSAMLGVGQNCDVALTDAYTTSRRQRKKVEMLFAHLKRILKLDRLRLRGPNGAKDEFLLAATAQNLRKMAKIIPLPIQAMPA